MKLVEFINEAIDHPDEPLWINPERVGAVYASDREDVTVIAIGRSGCPFASVPIPALPEAVPPPESVTPRS